jgi:hypothetical protein
MLVHATRVDPDHDCSTWQQRWEGPDGGLISAWIRGREKSREDPELRAAVERGELPILPWKGGVEQATKVGHKYGALLYVAMWQGLRGDALQIDTDIEVKLTCSRTGMTVTYTSDASKYSQQQ